MRLAKLVKTLLLCTFVLAAMTWLGSARRSPASASFDFSPGIPLPVGQDPGYVGTDTCKACHEDQFNAFSHTSHSKLGNISGWKNKVTGCEACHGPGKAHAEDGDP